MLLYLDANLNTWLNTLKEDPVRPQAMEPGLNDNKGHRAWAAIVATDDGATAPRRMPFQVREKRTKIAVKTSTKDLGITIDRSFEPP